MVPISILKKFTDMTEKDVDLDMMKDKHTKMSKHLSIIENKPTFGNYPTEFILEHF